MNPVEFFWDDLDETLHFFELSRNGQLPDAPQQALRQGREELRQSIDQKANELLRRQKVADKENDELIKMVDEVNFLEVVRLQSQNLQQQNGQLSNANQGLQERLKEGEKELKVEKQKKENLQTTLTNYQRQFKHTTLTKSDREINNITEQACRSISKKMRED